MSAEDVLYVYDCDDCDDCDDWGSDFSDIGIEEVMLMDDCPLGIDTELAGTFQLFAGKISTITTGYVCSNLGYMHCCGVN